MQLQRSHRNCNIYHGEALQARLREVGHLSRRVCVRDILSYLYDARRKTSGRILAVYGLRRTGKTTAILHAIASLPPEMFEKTVFIEYISTVELSALMDLMQDTYESGFEYVVIDEVTLIEGFSNWSSFLSDCHGHMQHVIISGTDSYAIREAARHTLFDRVELLHTTSITYKEARFLLKGISLEDFVRYGGTLCQEDSRKFVYKSSGATYEYLNSAIAGNVHNTLRHLNRPSDLIASLGSGWKDKEAFSSMILRAVNDDQHRFVQEVLSSAFSLSDLGAAKSQLAVLGRDTTEVCEFIAQANAAVSSMLNLDASLLSPSTHSIKWLYRTLHELDVFYPCRKLEANLKENIITPVQYRDYNVRELDSYMCVHPGMRYALTNVALQHMQGLTPAERIAIEQCGFGHIFEEVIVRETAMFHYNPQDIFARVQQIVVCGKEVDMTVYTNSYFYMIEIKHSNQIVPEQCKNIVHTDLATFSSLYASGLPVKRCVFYMGPTTTVQVEGYGILYQNIEEYLLDMKGFYTK